MIIAIVGVLLAVSPAAEKVSTVMDFRGVSVREVLEKLSGALHERVIISRQVLPETLERDIRLHTEHLSPEQAVRWVARLVGLEAVHTKEGFYVAPEGQLRLMGARIEGAGGIVLGTFAPSTATKPVKSSELTAEEEELISQTGPVFWQDVPLTRVAADISRVFHIDLIVHPALLEEPALFEWERPEVSLAEVCQHLAEVLKATVELRDGALWIHPPSESTTTAPENSKPVAVAEAVRPVEPASRPSTREAETQQPPRVVNTRRESQTGVSRSLPSDAGTVAIPPTPPSKVRSPAVAPAVRFTVDASVRDWSTFARHLESATGWSCPMRHQGTQYETLEVDGPVGQVLEALKLMRSLDYRVVQGGASEVPAIELEPLRPR